VTEGDGQHRGARARPQAAARSKAKRPGEDVGKAFTLASNSAPGAGRRTVTGQGEEPRKDAKPRQPPPRPSKPPARRAPPGQALARTCQRSARPPAASNPLTLTLSPIQAFTVRSAPTTHRFADAKRSQRPPYRFGRGPRKERKRIRFAAAKRSSGSACRARVGPRPGPSPGISPSGEGGSAGAQAGCYKRSAGAFRRSACRRPFLSAHPKQTHVAGAAANQRVKPRPGSISLRGSKLALPPL